jgi:comEA protein
MLGLTQQERRIVQLLLISFLLGIVVTVYKRVQADKRFKESVHLNQEPERFSSQSTIDSVVDKSISSFDSTFYLNDKNSRQKVNSLSQFAAKVNINTATIEELEILPGIGPALAKRIVAFRREQGEFKTTEAIKQVKGIGEKKYEQIQNLISVK